MMETTNQKSKRLIAPAQWRLFFLVLVLGLAGLFYVVLRRQGLYDSAALYIGLPLILALGVSLTPQTKSAIAATTKGITIALLLSAFVFQEGYVCIIMASPIFYGVGALVAYPIDRARKRKDKTINFQTAVIATLFSVLALEGTTEFTTLPRLHHVEVSKIVAAPLAAVQEQLSKAPEFNGTKPLFLKIFPYPTAISGQGLNVGDERTITFVAYKHIWWTQVEGSLVLKVAESHNNFIKFNIAKDDSYLSHYLKWQSSDVALESVDPAHTKVTWTLSYLRLLDPSWYFGPMQNYAVRLAAEELIEHVATPSQ